MTTGLSCYWLMDTIHKMVVGRTLFTFKHLIERTRTIFRSLVYPHPRESEIASTVAWRKVVVPIDPQAARSRLKFIIRKGIPDVFRPQVLQTFLQNINFEKVWTSIIGTKAKLLQQPYAYNEALNTTFGSTIVPEKIHNVPLVCILI